MIHARTLPETDFGASPYGGDPWRLRAGAAALALPRTPAMLALGNGFIGLRGPHQGVDEPKLYLNGVYERVPIHYHEGAHGFADGSDTRLPACDPSLLAIDVDGEPVDGWTSAELDLAAGMLTLSADLRGVRVTVERIVTMEANVVATRITLAAGRDAAIRIAAPIVSPAEYGQPIAEPGETYDPRVGAGFAESPWRETAAAPDGRADRLPSSGWTVACALAGGSSHRLSLGTGEQASIELFAAIEAERDADSEALLQRAYRAAADARARGFAALAEAQRAWWRQQWDAIGLALPAMPGAEQAMRHALFQLVQAAGRDGRTSLAAKGQTGEGYEGHVFWDADIYALPVLVHIAPATARAMLAWRIAHLGEARANARAMGQPRGALYPWRTIGGRECSAYFPSGSAQYHINADIAFALKTYIAATGDDSLLAEGGAEMLAETARIWLQIGFHDPRRGGGFVINRVTGPDEYSALVDNNLYTNLMAAAHLRFAVSAAADRLDADEAAAMTAAADAMVLPFDEERGIPAQDDGFFARQPWPFAETPPANFPLLLHYHPLIIYRHAVAKQADAVLAAALLPHAFDRATRARMLDVYEALTVHDSTLSAAPFAVAAADVGDGARAFDYWRVTTLTDLADLFGNTGHGLHMAALAGSWTALVRGIAGMRINNGLGFAPIAVPALGDYGFAIHYRGRRLHVAVGGGAVRYTLEQGEALDFCHADEMLTLAPGDSVERRLA